MSGFHFSNSIWPARNAALAVLVITFLGWPAHSTADTREQIDRGVERAVAWLEDTRETKRLARRAKAMLVFPDVIKMGFGVGGEFGEGALVVDGEIQDYYATAGKTFGMPEGSPFKAEVVLFFSTESYHSFRQIRSWRPARHGQVRVVNNPEDIRGALRDRSPLVGLIFTENGIVGGLDMSSDRITKIVR